MLDSGNEMNGVVVNLIRGDFGFEIKRSERTVLAANRVQFRIEIKNFLGCEVDNSQIGVPGTLQFSVTRSGKIAAEPGRSVEQFPQQIFKVAANLVDANDAPDGTIRCIHTS